MMLPHFAPFLKPMVIVNFIRARQSREGVYQNINRLGERGGERLTRFGRADMT